MQRAVYLAGLCLMATTVMTQDNNQKTVPADYQALFAKTEAVETKYFPSDSSWINRKTFLLKNLSGFPSHTNAAEDEWGGVVSEEKFATTGFFYTKKVDGRWWIIDPAGNKWYCKAVVSVAPNNSTRGKQVLVDSFKNMAAWTQATTSYLKSLGFNAAGSWSKIHEAKVPAAHKMVYSVVLDIMGAFGAYKKVAFQGTGHLDYKGGIMPVFDPEFGPYATQYVRQKVAGMKNDPFLLGYFSDNELTFRNDALNRFLQLPSSDINFQMVQAWTVANGVDTSAITTNDQQNFLAYYIDRYYKVVQAAIHSADSNHLFLGSRLHGVDKNRSVLFKITGQYADIVCYNYYKSWYPEQDVTQMWAQASGKPYMITEWYAKGEDSQMANETGWGWLVRTQEDRGRYYQNFALGLLADKNCVGWHWFKYMDNDPTGANDPSNKDSNKGIVSWDYKPYLPMVTKMSELNKAVYPLIQFFDKKLK